MNGLALGRDLFVLTAVIGMLCAAPGRARAAPTLSLADFDAEGLAGWQSSMSGEYYKGGEGQKGLSIVEDAQRGHKVLRADVRFADPKAEEKAFITKMLDPHLPRHKCRSLSFRYKLTTNRLSPTNALICRLRAEDNKFQDWIVARAGDIRPGEWARAELDLQKPERLVNIYGTYFSKVKELTFRLDDEAPLPDGKPKTPVDFSLFIDDIRVEPKDTAADKYEPARLRLRRDDSLDILLIRQSAAGFYNFDEAFAKLPRAKVTRLLFRGLHFPIFGFPTDEDLSAYDLIVLCDVDPYVLTGEQARLLADFVYSGGGLIFVAGPNTLTHSVDFKTAIATALPVTFEDGAKDVVVDAAPAPKATHVALRGIPSTFGRVHAVQALKPTEGASVLLTAKGQPVLVVGTFGDGRTAVVNAWPHIGRSARTDFFTADPFPDLAWSLALWAGRKATAVHIAGEDLPAGTVRPGETRRAALRLVAAKPTSCRVTAFIEGEAGALGEASKRLRPGVEEQLAFDVAIPKWPLARDARLAFVVTDEAGNELCRRESSISVVPPVVPRIAFPYGKAVFRPGSVLRFSVSADYPGLPEVTTGSRGVSLPVPGAEGEIALGRFVDAWVRSPVVNGDVVHCIAGDRQVATDVSYEGARTIIRQTGIVPGSRNDGKAYFTPDEIITAAREARVRPDGAVDVRVRYEFLQGLDVERLSTMIALPTSAFAGRAYVAKQAEGTTEGVIADEYAGKRMLFDGHGLDLTIETPAGDIAIAVPDESLRVWCQDLRFENNTPCVRVEIDSPVNGRKVGKGDSYTIAYAIKLPTAARVADVVSPDELELTVAVTDRNGRAIADEKHAGARRTDLAVPLPDLEAGSYDLACRFARRNGGEVVAEAAATFDIADPIDRENFFPLISFLGTGRGGHMVDEAGLRERTDDIWDHGFNTIAIGGLSNFARGDDSENIRLRNRAERYATQRNMGVIYEYEHYTTHHRGKPTTPCPFSPEYPDHFAERFASWVECAASVPRLLSLKVVDEPYASAANLDYSDVCKRTYRDLFGGELKAPDQIPASDIVARANLTRYVSRHVGREFEEGYRLKQKPNAPFDLLLTYMSPGFGYGRPKGSIEDTYGWTQFVDRADFDVYPYYYPASQRIRMVQANWCFGLMRNIAQSLGKPWGFYVELDDRNYPLQINPVEASAECAYTAIGQGADYLNSFINVAFGTGSQARPERWDFLGKELRKIRDIGPLLVRAQRPRARVAVLFPETHWLMTGDRYAPQYAYAALNAAFGDVDILHERIALKDGLEPYKGIVLLQVEYLPKRLAAALAEFVSKGGVLVWDHVPSRDENDEPLEWPEAMTRMPQGGPPNEESVTQKVGDGWVVRFRSNVDEAYHDAVEVAQNAAAQRSLQDELRAGLSGAGLRPRISSNHPELEAGLRLADGCALVVLTNHSAAPVNARVTLRDLPFAARFACDMSGGKPVELKRSDGALILRASLKGRHGRIVGLYPSRPDRLRLDVRTSSSAPGSDLAYEVTVLDARGKPAGGQHPLLIEVKDASGMVLGRYGGPQCATDGRLVIKRRLAVNAAKGRWTIRVACPIIRQSVEGSFKVE